MANVMATAQTSVSGSWNEFGIANNTLVTEQVFLNKEGKHGEMFADLSIGYDPSTEFEVH